MKFDPSKAHYVVLIYGSCNTQFPIMSSVVTQCTFFKDVSTKGATLTKLSHLCHRRSCIWLMNEFYWWEIVGVSWMCWLVNYVHAACLLSKPAVKERNIHDLCLYTQMCVCVCVEVLKTSDACMCICRIQRTVLSSDFLRPMSWGNSGPLMISYLKSPQTLNELIAEIVCPLLRALTRMPHELQIRYRGHSSSSASVFIHKWMCEMCVCELSP